MSPETRDFLSIVRGAEDPSPSDEIRVLAAVQASIGGGPTSIAPGDARGPKGVASGAGSALKLLGVLLGVSVGAALVASAVSSRPAKPSVASSPNGSPLASTVVHSIAPAATSAAPPPSAVASPATTPPSAVHVARAATPSTAHGEPAVRAEASGAASLREEIALLAGVQAALERGDGAEALRRLDRHATSDRQFVAERRAARIAALCQLGRVPEARQLAAIFMRENARSVQRTAVERSCAATKTDLER